jgi:hypothetical protein
MSLPPNTPACSLPEWGDAPGRRPAGFALRPGRVFSKSFTLRGGRNATNDRSWPETSFETDHELVANPDEGKQTHLGIAEAFCLKSRRHRHAEVLSSNLS